MIEQGEKKKDKNKLKKGKEEDRKEGKQRKKNYLSIALCYVCVYHKNKNWFGFDDGTKDFAGLNKLKYMFHQFGIHAYVKYI